MKTERPAVIFLPEKNMNQEGEGDEPPRKNGYLPAGVVHVSREDLRRFLKCKRVGNYLLGKNIGEGSFARVKQGFHVLTGERVAVKIIDKRQAQHDKYVAKNMRREAKILQMVRHPNVVQLLEVVETENRYYLVTELAAGGDLMDYICYRKKLGEVEVRKFIRQIVSAVHYLHRGGILHRDLKVENLLLDDDYNIKIIDFGLSNTIYGPASEGQSMKDHCKTQCGSPAYAAPEILGHKPYGPQVDVWSIGVNMYAMLTGKLPYTAEPFHITTLYNKMKMGDMNEIPEHLSYGCKDLIQRFLTFNPEKRITLEEALNHEWLSKDQQQLSTLVTFPNYLNEGVMNEDVVNHMVEKMQFKRLETIEAVIQNRPTPASCVYHLLCKKLKRYLEKHPEVKLKTPTVKAESSSLRKKLPRFEKSKITGAADGRRVIRPEDRTSSSHEKVIAERIFVEDEKQREKHPDCSKPTEEVLKPSVKPKSNSSALEVEAFLVSQSTHDLSEGEENPVKTTVTPYVEQGKEVSPSSESPVVSIMALGNSTCSVTSTASQESPRTRTDSTSSEIVTINRRRASQNVSHISVESRSTSGQRDSQKNTSVSISSFKSVGHDVRDSEVSSSGWNSKASTDENPEAPSRCRSYSCNHVKVPTMVKVEPVNAKVVSIPLSFRRRSGSLDQVRYPGRMTLPRPRNHMESTATQSNRRTLHKQEDEILAASKGLSSSPLSQNSTESKSPRVSPSRVNRISVASIAPYGLCCQVTRLSNTDLHSGGEVYGRERLRDAKKTFSLGRRFSGNLARSDSDSGSPKLSRRTAAQRHSIAAVDGTELAKSIDESLSKTARTQGEMPLRLPLARKSVDGIREWRRSQESSRTGERDTDDPRTSARDAAVFLLQGKTDNGPVEPGASTYNRWRTKNGAMDHAESRGVCLPPAAGATPPNSFRKQIMSEVLDLPCASKESPRQVSRRLDRDATAEPRDRRATPHVRDPDYITHLSQLGRTRQHDKEKIPQVNKKEQDERIERRRFSEPSSRMNLTVSPPLLTSARDTVMKPFMHRKSRDRNQ